jgi:hypothetical protein
LYISPVWRFDDQILIEEGSMTNLRLRMTGLSTNEWLQDYQRNLANAGIEAQVELRQPKPPMGPAMLDPTVLSAIIQGGSAIVGAALTAFIAAYVALKMKDRSPPTNPPRQINVAFRLSSETRYLIVDAQDMGRLASLLSETVPEIQEVREVSIAENYE